MKNLHGSVFCFLANSKKGVEGETSIVSAVSGLNLGIVKSS